MERRKVTKRQKMIVGIVLGVAAVLLVVVLALSLSGKRKVDESVFVPGDGRLVVSMSAEVASFEDGDYEPGITRIIYYHNGKNITGMKVYFEYSTEEEARTANEHITIDEKEWAENKDLNGKFIVFDVKPNQYAGLSVEYMQETIKNMREAGTLLDDGSETEEEVLDVEEAVDEEGTDETPEAEDAENSESEQ